MVIVLIGAATAAAVRYRFSWRSFAISIGVLEVLSFLLLGLPGAAFLEAIAPVMQRMGYSRITADAAWPAAIMMSLAWPLTLVPSYAAWPAGRSATSARFSGVPLYDLLNFSGVASTPIVPVFPCIVLAIRAARLDSIEALRKSQVSWIAASGHVSGKGCLAGSIEP